MKKSGFWMMLLVLILSACTKNENEKEQDTDPSETKPLVAKGIGTSKEAPEGEFFHLPAGIELESERIKAYERSECPCKPEQKDCEKGTGGLVILCLSLRNTTSSPISVTLPAGLIFESFSLTTQNGLLLQVESFEVPPGTYNIKLNLYCANADRTGSRPGDEFKLGPIVKYDQIIELIELLTKKIIDETTEARVQAVVWNISDNGLTAFDRERIAQLPDR